MRVLQVIPAVAPCYGGPSQAVLGMSAAVQAWNVDTLIATTDADGRDRLPVQLGTPLEWRGAATIFFPRQWSEAWKYSRPLARWLEAHVSEYDVVHIHAVFSHACVAAARACRKRGVPYVVRPLGTLDPWSLRQKPLRKRVLWHLAVKRMLVDAAAIQYTTVSEQELAEGALGLRRGVIIPLAVDDAVFDFPDLTHTFRDTHPTLEDDPYVLALGRVHPKKGLEHLLDAFVRAIQLTHLRHWRLVVAGDGERAYLEALKRRVHDHNADSKVVFTGWIDGVDKIAALRGAAMFALTSHQENFGLGVAEALACGVPVLVSTNVNLATEIAAADAGWVAPLESRAIDACLLEALDRGDERRRRGDCGRLLADAHWRWSSVASQLVELYSAVQL